MDCPDKVEALKTYQVMPEIIEELQHNACKERYPLSLDLLTNFLARILLSEMIIVYTNIQFISTSKHEQSYYIRY